MKKATRPAARKRAATKTKTDSTLNLLLKSLAEMYPKDKTSPGIVAAWLSDKQKFYVSIVRYDQPMGQGKQVMTAHLANTFNEAVTGVAKQWMNGTSSVRQLRRRLSADIDFDFDWEAGDR